MIIGDLWKHKKGEVACIGTVGAIVGMDRSFLFRLSTKIITFFEMINSFIVAYKYNQMSQLPVNGGICGDLAVWQLFFKNTIFNADIAL